MTKEAGEYGIKWALEEKFDIDALPSIREVLFGIMMFYDKELDFRTQGMSK